MNKITKLLYIIITIAVLSTLFVFGCGVTPNDNKKEEFFKAVGYAEDFGYKAVRDGRKNTGGKIEFFTKEVLEPKITLSSLQIRDGEYQLSVKDDSFGKVSVKNGKCEFKSSLQNLELGGVFEFTFEGANGIYRQKLKHVSKAIENYEDLARCLTYYNTYTSNVDDSPSPSNKEKEKFYDGESFSQRLYVLANDLAVTSEQFSWGYNGRTMGDVNDYDFGSVISDQSGSYFYDIFDGQGYTLITDTISGGIFGHLGRNAVIKNLKIEAKAPYWNNTHSKKIPRRIIAKAIAKDALIENVVIRIDQDCHVPYVNVLSTYTHKNAKLKDVLIVLGEKLYVDTEHKDYPFVKDLSRGYLGEKFYPESVEDVYVVAPHLSEASFYKLGENNYKYIYAENQPEADEYDYIEGCFYYEHISDLVDERPNVGSWYIDDNGLIRYR